MSAVRRLLEDPARLRALIDEEQAEFVSLLRDLDEGEWQKPSLCRRWRVREVAVHIAIHIHTRDRQRSMEVLRAGLSETRHVREHESKSDAQVVDWLAEPPVLSTPFNMRTQLAELIVHQQDVRRPLGRVRSIPAERLVPVLDASLTIRGGAAVNFGMLRARGLRLVATDMDWSTGSGAVVRGPGEAVFMAINGRSHAVADLTGEGVAKLSRRIRH